MRSYGDGSVSKSTGCTCMRSRVQIPRKKLGVGCTCNPSLVWDGDRKIAGAYLAPAKLQAEQETLSQENNGGVMEQDT